MPGHNTYFQFKQFRIDQDRCAMKVTTDACILGAWFASRYLPAKKILDIGAGTGLLMLMLAQRGYQVDGIEIDIPAFEQAKVNIEKSPWADVIKIFAGDVRDYPLPDPYDFIISNPPFFEGDLLSAASNKNIAKHSDKLSLHELIKAIDKNLSPDGSFGVLLPQHRSGYFEQLAEQQGFFLKERLLVKQTPAHTFFRSVLWFSRKQELLKHEELTIKDANGHYTKAFAGLMKDYYLPHP